MDKNDFIEKAKTIHSNKYDYTKVEYVNASTKVCIVCPEHGEFWQDPKHHLKGQGCPKCSKISSSQKKTLTTEEFIQRARKVHDNKYDYSKVVYEKNNKKVCIICPEHGEFWQTPHNHLKGQGCPKCSGRFQTDTEYFIEKAKKIHGNKYDYSKVEYVDSHTKVCIICPEHGEFWQSPQNHLQKKGCTKCGIENMKNSKTYSNDEFIALCKEVHGDKYDYSKTEYVDNNTKICIICPEHGEFWQKPYVHLQGYGCSKCSGKYNYTTDEFIEEVKKIHGDKYDYSKLEYVNSHGKVKIICPIHGIFEQRAYEHLQGRGCPKSSHTCSNAEQELTDFVNELCGFVITKDKEILNGKELDIYIPNKKLAIEYDGLVWHSEKFNKQWDYHLMKTLECEKQGIRLIHIFEDEWLEHKEIVKTKLKHILGCDMDLPKVFARKCVVNEIDKETAMIFLDKNHIQGFAKSSVYLGCFYDDELVGVMSFKRERKDSDKWELTRFATDITKHCVGVGGKLFTYFIKEYKPNEVKSFADRRWTTTLNYTLYDRLGFKKVQTMRPDYRYVVNTKRMHKFGFRKERLLKKYSDKGIDFHMTEHEICKKLGFYRIYDCGLIKYKWFS